MMSNPQLLIIPCLTVKSGSGKTVGKVVGKQTLCNLEGCTGVRVSVRWPSGKLTRPCTKGMTVLDAKKGKWQIG